MTLAPEVYAGLTAEASVTMMMSVITGRYHPVAGLSGVRAWEASG